MSIDSSNPGASSRRSRRASRRAVDTTTREGYTQGVRRHTFLDDVVFKVVFGSEDGATLLRPLTNALQRDLNGTHRFPPSRSGSTS